ncbi:MAG: L-threonylcarbamoyladenylate synthase [Clostridium sp.]|nr:L-threonylcarbamoyladenylate synthase [Acetatifactor muris]MCM1525843.1 L-threonylcarbamoyladenylate synthase [Bacteroides sp.]MCM1562617.1 L-threonylcarbamoyladenylate synthase [Clostridium sp.]
METRWIVISVKNDGGEFSAEETAGLREAGAVIRRGGLVAFPTETVYGLGGDALNPDSARRIYEAKGRPSDNPLIVHIADREALPAIVSGIPESARRLAEAFWPGPLTMILPKSDAVPYETTGGLDTVAVRMPSHPVALGLIRESGGYVAAPSANTSGKPSPTLAAHVAEDMDGRIDMILDGGEPVIGLESTIVDLTVDPPRILRPGYITRGMLKQVIGEVETDVTILKSAEDCGQAPKAPGMKYRHYAPKGELLIVRGRPEAVVEYINARTDADRAAGEKTGVIGTEELLDLYRADVVKNIGSRADEEMIAGRLYAILREFDGEGVTRIYSEAFSSEGLGQAIMNRLLKAAGHKMIEV